MKESLKNDDIKNNNILILPFNTLVVEKIEDSNSEEYQKIIYLKYLTDYEKIIKDQFDANFKSSEAIDMKSESKRKEVIEKALNTFSNQKIILFIDHIQDAKK